ncbi:hypothetical protein [Neptunomonas sp.]|uniref:hypothetical protein n=1 Tax=Neptunomonas sp. TaxID=1971898 RepID=UPI003566A6B6
MGKTVTQRVVLTLEDGLLAGDPQRWIAHETQLNVAGSGLSPETALVNLAQKLGEHIERLWAKLNEGE